MLNNFLKQYPVCRFTEIRIQIKSKVNQNKNLCLQSKDYLFLVVHKKPKNKFKFRLNTIVNFYLPSLQTINSRLIKTILMQLLKQQAQLEVEQLRTQPFQKEVPKNTQFIPFVKERDALGRLIRSQSISQNKYQMRFIDQPSPNKRQKNYQKSAKGLEQQIQKHFKNGTAMNVVHPSKSKVHKKLTLQLISQRTSSKASQRARLSGRTSKQLLLLRPFTQSSTLIKSQQLFRPNSTQKNDFQLKRSNSSVLPSKKINPKRRFFSSSVQKKQSYNQANLKMYQMDTKYPQLYRVRKMKQLEIKIQNDFQERHGQFLRKIIKSKQLAFEIGVGLDKIDDLC